MTAAEKKYKLAYLQQLKPLFVFMLFFMLVYGFLFWGSQQWSATKGAKNAFTNTFNSIIRLHKSNVAIAAQTLGRKEIGNTNYTHQFLLGNHKMRKAAIRSGKNDFKVVIVKTDYWYVFISPFILMLALIIVTPLGSFKRKLGAIVGGMLLVTIYLVAKLSIHFIYKFSENPWTDIVNLSPFQAKTIQQLDNLFYLNAEVGLFVPIIIWALVCFRKNDLTRFYERFAPPSVVSTLEK